MNLHSALVGSIYHSIRLIDALLCPLIRLTSLDMLAFYYPLLYINIWPSTPKVLPPLKRTLNTFLEHIHWSCSIEQKCFLFLFGALWILFHALWSMKELKNSIFSLHFGDMLLHASIMLVDLDCHQKVRKKSGWMTDREKVKIKSFH